MSTATTTIDALKDTLDGHVIRPGDDDYDAAREVFYGGIDKRPAAIARVASDDDIRRVIEAARDSGSELAVRGGGHSLAGSSSSEGGIVLDLRDLKEIEVDGDTALAGAGLTAAEYTKAVGERGLATGFGDTGSVGISGITLGGGVGFLVRKHGLTVDNLLGADVVTADGELLTADRNTNPDLFWAIRGGGGNFGVVSRFRYALQPLDGIVGGMLFLPARPEVITGFLELANDASNQLSTILNVMTAPPMPLIPEEFHGSPIVMALICYAGDVRAGERAVAPFKALAEPLADMVRPITYPEMYPEMPEGPKVTAAEQTGFLDAAPDATEILERLQQPVGAMRVVQLRVLGGVAEEVPPGETAYAHRSRKIMSNVATVYMQPDERAAAEAWVEGLASSLFGDDLGGYVNFLGHVGPEGVRAAYPGDTWDRLREIKRKYDPANLFHMNQNIPPAEG
jgi:FAD binding domain-containing protein/berberine-like enzyme